MESLFFYLLRASVLMVLFYGIYRLFFAQNTFHAANRLTLLCMQLMITVLPLFRYNFLPKEDANVASNTSSVDYTTLIDNSLVLDRTSPEIPWTEILFGLFILGFLFTLFRYLIGLYQIIHIIRTSEKQMQGDRTILCVTDKIVSPFSWMRYVVITRAELLESHEAIIHHEKAHMQLHHSFDMILFDLFTAIFWFNPFSWLIRREMQSIHEYQADNHVLRQGVDTKQYQLLLIRKSAGEFKFALANNFRQRDLHKRIKMMKKSKTDQQMKWVYAMVLPALFLSMSLLSVPTLNAKTTLMQNDATLMPKETAMPIDTGVVEVRVIGYGKMDSTKMSNVPLVIVNGKKVTREELEGLQPDEIEAINVIKDKKDTEAYGEERREGVILIKTNKKIVDGDTSEVLFTRTTKGTVRIMMDKLTENTPVRVHQFSGSKPLIIIDGEKMAYDFKINSINPSEIESIEVLKNNSSIDFYGEEAKDGVIIITRKKKNK
jgi:beta-lactamase regulating signal transducer with metallopeptidase domain